MLEPITISPPLMLLIKEGSGWTGSCHSEHRRSRSFLRVTDAGSGATLRHLGVTPLRVSEP